MQFWGRGPSQGLTRALVAYRAFRAHAIHSCPHACLEGARHSVDDTTRITISEQLHRGTWGLNKDAVVGSYPACRGNERATGPTQGHWGCMDGGIHRGVVAGGAFLGTWRIPSEAPSIRAPPIWSPAPCSPCSPVLSWPCVGCAAAGPPQPCTPWRTAHGLKATDAAVRSMCVCVCVGVHVHRSRIVPRLPSVPCSRHSGSPAHHAPHGPIAPALCYRRGRRPLLAAPHGCTRGSAWDHHHA